MVEGEQPALVGRLQHRHAGRHEVRRRVLVDLALERLGELMDATRRLGCLCLALGELRHLEIGQRLRPLVRRGLEKRVKVDHDRGAVLGLGAQRQ